MKVNNISSYTLNKAQKLSSNKANYATNPFNSTSKSKLKQDEISFTAKGMDRLIQGKLQDYFTAEAQDIYNTAETIAINTNSEKIEMWHLYYASLLALQATLDDIESGRITPETAENRNTLYQTVATLAGVDEDEFKEENIRKIVIDVVNKHIKLAQEAYFPKATENEEKRQLTFNLGKKQINIPLLTPKKIVRPKLSDDAKSELIGLFSKLGNVNGESVFLDGYYLNSALNYPDKKMTKVATDFMHDLKERIAVKSDEKDKKPLGFYNNYADIVEKNINIGNDVLVTYNVDNIDGRDNLISSIAAKYKDSDTEVITLNDYADFEFFNYYTRKQAKDKTKKKIIIADFSSMGVRARKSKGSFILNQNELAAINNSTKDKKNPNLRIVLTMPLEAYIANNANPMIKDVFKTYNNLSLPTMNVDEAKKYLTGKDGLEYLKEAVGVDLSGQVVEKAIELTAQDKGFYPVKIVDLLSGLVRYNIDKKELTPELLEQYVKENTALGKTKDTDEQSLQIELNTKNRLNDIMGTPMTKAEALNIVNQIKKGTFKTKGYTIYQANGSAYGGGRRHTAQAIAGETGIPMITINAKDFALKEWDAQSANSDFSEMKIKRIITAAKAQAEANPNKTAMIFIENFDNFGANSLYGVSSAYEQKAFNQLLLEMKKAKQEDKVNLLVIGSVNHSELLDENILKPDKFLNTILVYQPMDAKSRREIIEYYINKMNLPIKGENEEEKAKVIQNISETTQGFSVVDLMYLLETAKSVSLERDKKTIDDYDLTEAYLQVTSGRVNTYESTEQRNRIVAAHEAGHAINLYIMNEIEKENNIPQFMPRSNVNFITLDPRGNFGGAMYYKPDKNDEYNIHTVMADLVCSYGGHTVEKLLYNQNGSWGISCDIENITKTATQAVLHLGMGPKTGTRKILFGPNGDLIASDKKKLEIEEDIDYLCHTAKEVSEIIIKAYQPFIKQFSDKYYSKVGSGDCLITKEQFVKELNEWINSLTDEEKAELKQIKHRCAQKIKRVEEAQAKLSKDC